MVCYYSWIQQREQLQFTSTVVYYNTYDKELKKENRRIVLYVEYIDIGNGNAILRTR